MEVWKDIYFIENGVEHDYRGLYQVSNTGEVKGLGNGFSHKKEKILKKWENEKKYLIVRLSKNGKRKDFRVHRLVAHMFLNDYFEGAEIDHIDTNRQNNHVNNLKWCTHKENCNNELSKKNMRKTF